MEPLGVEVGIDPRKVGALIIRIGFSAPYSNYSKEPLRKNVSNYYFGFYINVKVRIAIDCIPV